MGRSEELRLRFALDPTEDPLLYFLLSNTDSKSRAKVVRSLLRRLATHQLGITASDLPESLRLIYTASLNLEQSSTLSTPVIAPNPPSPAARTAEKAKQPIRVERTVAPKPATSTEEVRGNSSADMSLDEAADFELPPFILKDGLGVLAEGANY